MQLLDTLKLDSGVYNLLLHPRLIDSYSFSWHFKLNDSFRFLSIINTLFSLLLYIFKFNSLPIFFLVLVPKRTASVNRGQREYIYFQNQLVLICSTTLFLVFFYILLNAAMKYIYTDSTKSRAGTYQLISEGESIILYLSLV